MALWRDPLDELIEDLEHAVPPTGPAFSHTGPPLEDLQLAVSLVLYAKTDDEKAEADRFVKEITRPGYRTKFPASRGL